MNDRRPSSHLGRRTLAGLAGASLLSAGAPRAAAQPANFRVVHALPVPCAAGPGDIVGLLLEGSGTPAGSVVVFGQAFKAGDLPRGARLTGRLAGTGRAVPVQADVTTRHADGSALFAVVSLAAPALRAGERLGVVLARSEGEAPDTPFDLAAAAAGRSATVEITPEAGGAPWQVDLLQHMQDAVQQRRARAIWQQGPLGVQARVHLPVPPAAVGGVTSARLVADVALRADGSLWVDAWLRNDIAMRPGGGVAIYAMRVVLDGREALRTELLRQFQYTGFGRLLGSLRGGAPAPPPVHIRHDVGYLADGGALARYDQSVGVEEAQLVRFGQMLTGPDWQTPFSPRGIQRSMGMAGNRPDIGPMTLWQAAWVVGGDRRAADVAIGQAEADGAIPWHFWDVGGGADGSGGWMDVKRWPQFWTDPRGGRPPRTLMQPMPTMAESGWGANRSHQPDLSYVPYLLTGRRAFVDALMSQGVWGIIGGWHAPRAMAEGYPAVADMNVVHASQVRSAAWCLRTLGNAAWIAPDGDASTAFLRTAIAANWGWMRAQIPRWTADQGEAHGWLDTTNAIGEIGAGAPWQTDFVIGSVAAATRRGSEDARALLQWMSNFAIGRFHAEARGFNPRDGVAYRITLAASGERPLRFHQTWAAIGADMRARGFSNDAGWKQSEGYYGRLALYSLATLYEVLGDARAVQAYRWLQEAAPPFTRTWLYARDPTLAVMPPATPRDPARAIACTQAASSRP